MARNNSGKWVARAAATGGGRTYRGQRPTNWYAAVVIIVVLGIASVVFAGYEYRHPAAAANTIAPKKGTTWYAGLAFYVCGTQLPSVPSNAETTTTKQSFYTTGEGVITVSPKTTSVSGNNAVLGKFVSAYPGMTISATEIKVPSATSTTTTTTTTAKSKAATTPAVTYKNGEACPKGTPDAGKKGTVQVVNWTSAFNAKGKAIPVTGDPGTLKFTQNQLITVGFVPKGTTLPKPNGTVVKALLGASTGSTATTTTAAGSTTTTTAAATTTTTAAATTTTTAAPTTTTTAAKATTTTAAKKSSK